MTRLITEWVEPMLTGMDDYNRLLKYRTRLNLCELMKRTFSFSCEYVDKIQKKIKVGVVPVTQGEGIIGCFSESVAAIARSMGFQAEVMTHTDVDGLYEAYCRNCGVVFMADDNRYLAVNTNMHKTSDNNYATALGYIRVLEAMSEVAGDCDRKQSCPVLVIGYGLVGREAAKILDREGVEYYVFDKNPEAQGKSERPLPEEMRIADFKYILDFTNEGDWLSADMLAKDACYASPGVPCSLTEDARELLGDRAVYDSLEIGTAIMLGEALSL